MGNNDHLTWDDAAPAPFEAGWLVLSKVLSLNYMTMKELVHLIAKPGQRTGAVSLRSLATDSSWIEFNTYSDLLRIEKARLENGFLDTFFKHCRHIKEPEPYGPRFCPSCRKLGYTCCFFDLAMVSECPWHGDLLLPDRCECIALPLKSKGKFRSEFDGRAACKICGKQRERYVRPEHINRLNNEMQTKIESRCRILLNWWDSLEQAVPQPDLIFDGLVGVGSQLGDASLRAASHHGAADKLASFRLPWALAFGIEKVRYLHWRADITKGPDVNTELKIRSEVGQSYRSIRRHFFKKYLRSKHKACLAALSQLTDEQLQALDGRFVCKFALTYLLWRLSIEGLTHVYKINLPRKDDYRLHLMGPSFDPISNASSLHWTYCSFFGIWGKVSNYCGATEIIVESRKEMRFSGFIEVKYYLHSDTQKSPVSKTIDYHVILRDITLYSKLNRTCLKILNPEVLSSAKRIERNSTWDWARDHSALANQIMTITAPNLSALAGKIFFQV